MVQKGKFVLFSISGFIAMYKTIKRTKPQKHFKEESQYECRRPRFNKDFYKKDYILIHDK